MDDEKETKYCDECGKEITLEYYYIGDNNAAMTTPTDTFCSEDCILKYLMVDCAFVRHDTDQDNDTIIDALLRGEDL